MTQKPAHPVGSSRSRGLLHRGTCSSTRATHTSLSKQSSQYLVALAFWLVASVSASPVGEEVFSIVGNDGSPFKRALIIVDVGVILVVMIVVKFSVSFENVVVIGSPDVTFCPVNLPADLRYCWMIWSFSGSARRRDAISHHAWKTYYHIPEERNGSTD